MSVDNNAPWLTNFNSKGFPKKLAECHTIPALSTKADKQMPRFLSKALVQSMDVDDDEAFVDEGGKFHIVRLKSPAALDRESARMKHCIGLGGYDAKLADADCLLLSLRDRSDAPLLTIEV